LQGLSKKILFRIANHVLNHILYSKEFFNSVRRIGAYMKQTIDIDFSLLDSLPNKIFIKDLDLNYLYCNSEYAQDIGISQLQIVGKDDYEIHPEEIARLYREGDKDVIRSGEKKVYTEQYTSATGKYWVKTTKVPYLDKNKKISGVLGVFEDITDQKHYAETQQRFHTILESTGDLVATSTPDGRITYLNEPGRVLLGLAKEESIVGKNISDSHPIWAAQIVKEIAVPRAIEKGIWKGESAVLDKQGQEIPVSQVIMSHKSEDDSIEYLSTIIRDIRREKEAQYELEQDARERERINRELTLKTKAIDTSMVAMAFGDKTGILRSVNQAFLNLWNITEDEVIGKSSIEFWENPEKAKAVIKELSNNGYWSGEMCGKRPDNSVFHALLVANAVKNDAGKTDSLMATFMDITQRKEDERKLKEQADQFNIFKNTTQDGFWLIDVEGHLVDTNDAAAHMLGYSQEELKGLNITDIESVETPDETAAHIKTIIEKGFDFFQSKHKRKDGTIINVEISAAYWGEQKHFFAYIRDITKRVKEEKELKRLRHELEKLVVRRTKELETALVSAENANKTKNIFISKMSHELRTPLNSIIGFAQLLAIDKKKTLTPEQTENLQEILQGGSHLLTLIDRILEVSSTTDKPLVTHFKPVLCAPLINEVIKNLETFAQESHITISTNINKECRVIADDQNLRRVLHTIISNAVKYNRKNGTVKIKCGANLGHVHIEVTDTGIGIPEKYQDKIFEPFTQIESTQDIFNGVGIELALARHIIKEMNGDIGMESTKGVGSRFWIDLPCSTEKVNGGSD